MQAFPDVPSHEDAPEVFEEGHLWLLEWVGGAPLRFRVTDSGLEFADDERPLVQWDEPAAYAFAVRWVRDRFDVEAFREAVDDPGSYTFLGIATRNEGVEYDWDRLPGFLGVDVHAPDRGFRTPDVASRAFERLGLDPLNAVAKELPARDVRPGRYEHPDSAWRDGPVAGVLARNKSGGRTTIANPAVEPASPPTIDPASLVERAVTPARIDRAADAAPGHPTVDAVLDRLVASLVREQYAALDDPDDAAATIRTAAAEPVARHLGQ